MFRSPHAAFCSGTGADNLVGGGTSFTEVELTTTGGALSARLPGSAAIAEQGAMFVASPRAPSRWTPPQVRSRVGGAGLGRGGCRPRRFDQPAYAAPPDARRMHCIARSPLTFQAKKSKPLTLLPLVALIFFDVAGGPFGIEVR